MVFGAVTRIITVITGAVRALCARCAKTPPNNRRPPPPPNSNVPEGQAASRPMDSRNADRTACATPVKGFGYKALSGTCCSQVPYSTLEEGLIEKNVKVWQTSLGAQPRPHGQPSAACLRVCVQHDAARACALVLHTVQKCGRHIPL